MIISLIIFEPRLKPPGLGDRPSVARYSGELGKEAEDRKIQGLFITCLAVSSASQKWMLEQSEMAEHCL